MSDLVRARLGRVEKSVSRGLAERCDLEILDEPARREDGQIRPTTRVNGRPMKPKTSVAQAAASKKKVPAKKAAPKKKAATRGASKPEEAQQ